MTDSMIVVAVALFTCGIFGLIGVYIAMQKGRSEGEGFCLGCFLGPLGLILAALLPTKERHEQHREVRFHNGPADEDWESIRRRMR